MNTAPSLHVLHSCNMTNWLGYTNNESWIFFDAKQVIYVTAGTYILFNDFFSLKKGDTERKNWYVAIDLQYYQIKQKLSCHFLMRGFSTWVSAYREEGRTLPSLWLTKSSLSPFMESFLSLCGDSPALGERFWLIINVILHVVAFKFSYSSDRRFCKQPVNWIV